MKIKNIRILLTLLSAALVPLACTLFVGGPDYPTNSIPVSTEAVGNLELQLNAAQTMAAETGLITLSINETQITSILANQLAVQADPLIQNPQVYLQNNEIQVYGQASRGNLSANVRVILKASIDQEGQPAIEISSADFGPFPAPAGLNTYISSIIDQAFTGTFGPAATGLRLESIVISDGVMTFTGRVK